MHKTLAKVASLAMVLGLATPAFASNSNFKEFKGFKSPSFTNTATVQDNNVNVSANTGFNIQTGSASTDVTAGNPVDSLSYSWKHKNDHQQPLLIQSIGSSVDQMLQTGDALANGQTQITVNTLDPSMMDMHNSMMDKWHNNNQMSFTNTANIKYNDVNVSANTGYNTQTGTASTSVSGGKTGTIQGIGSTVSQGLMTGNAEANGSLWIVANAPSMSVAN
jgi:hypothetical protein